MTVGKKLWAAFDLALSPFALVFSPIAYALGRASRRPSLSRRIMDMAGVGVVLRHYTEPLVRPADLRMPLDEPRRLPGIDMNEAAQLALVGTFAWRGELERFPLTGDGLGFHYRNGMFEQGDAEFLYGMIRHFKPRRIIEIGSGHSTKLAAAAVAANGRDNPGYVCDHVCIEPFRAPWLDALGVRVIRERVELLPLSTFAELESGDILFIDSSHVIRPQGDVLFEYLEILPMLAPGVLVHIHDIFSPRDYLAEWVIDRRLMWNEQYLLEAFLSFNDQFEVVLAANWMWHAHPEKLTDAAPMLCAAGAKEPGSFWIRRRE